jgi:hypothetical protein
MRIRILNTLKTTAAMRRSNEIIAKVLTALNHSKIIKKKSAEQNLSIFELLCLMMILYTN